MMGGGEPRPYQYRGVTGQSPVPKKDFDFKDFDFDFDFKDLKDF
jgi:hypothetical protein